MKYTEINVLQWKNKCTYNYWVYWCARISKIAIKVYTTIQLLINNVEAQFRIYQSKYWIFKLGYRTRKVNISMDTLLNLKNYHDKLWINFFYFTGLKSSSIITILRLIGRMFYFALKVYVELKWSCYIFVRRDILLCRYKN